MLRKESPLRVDGGVAQNDFLVQMISTLTGKPVERPMSTDVSVLGAAFLAGMGAGKHQRELLAHVSERLSSKIFYGDFSVLCILFSFTTFSLLTSMVEEVGGLKVGKE